jgi:hypothetical protein
MGVLHKLSRLVAGSALAARYDAVDALTHCYVECVQRARRLAGHADLAPHAYSAEALRELAEAEDTQAGRVRDALHAVGAEVPNLPDAPPLSGAPNLWGRLVQDLEAHRTSARRLRELAVHFAESLPTTAALFDELCREESTHCERLRTLIARADPQALD